MITAETARTDRDGRCGQAMVEFTVGLVAVVVLLAGLVQLTSLTRAHTETMVEARRLAARTAMLDADARSVPPPEFVREVLEGPDRKRHSADDTVSQADAGAFRNTFVEKAGAPNVPAWDIIDKVPRNRFTRLRSAAQPVNEFGLVRGFDSQRVYLISAVQSLLYGADAIDVENEVWMTQMRGIY